MQHLALLLVACLASTRGRHFSVLPSSHRKQFKLELVHTNLCGPMDAVSLGGKRYLLTFIDNCTRKVWACFLEAKSAVLECLQFSKADVEKQ